MGSCEMYIIVAPLVELPLLAPDAMLPLPAPDFSRSRLAAARDDDEMKSLSRLCFLPDLCSLLLSLYDGVFELLDDDETPL
jgi:hypothetical protein